MWLKGEGGVLVKCGLSDSSGRQPPHFPPTQSQLSEGIKFFLQEVT